MISGNVTSQLPSGSLRILATTRSLIALGPAANRGRGMARGPARWLAAFLVAGPCRGARALWFGIYPNRIRSSRDFLAAGLRRACSVTFQFFGGRIGRSTVHRSRQCTALGGLLVYCSRHLMSDQSAGVIAGKVAFRALSGTRVLTAEFQFATLEKRLTALRDARPARRCGQHRLRRYAVRPLAS